ncbi:MAG: ABC transporter substrate-binding protein, partial [Lachnospiraceae bacterium]|nr:ABC transporter substrate-binding protein [Lachnospiraceae bacterium]
MGKEEIHMQKRSLKPLFLMSVLFSLTIALTGCAGDKAKSSSEITIGIAQDIEDSLDPHKAVAAGTKEILFNLFEGLVKPDADGNLIDAVASAHEVSEDGKTYTFTLRDGVKFHDGSTVTADDVKYSIDRCADTSEGDPLVSAFSNIENVMVVDDKTIVVQLYESDTEFLAYMTTAIIPKKNTSPDTTPIGTGPYKYVSRSPQENIILEKFDEYWGTPANIGKITLKIIADPDSIAMNLNGGAIDMFMRITTGQMNELSGDFEVYEGTMNLVQALYLNNDFEPFRDEKVRQALCYAVDKEEIFDILSDGKGSELGSSVFPSFGKYYMEELNDVYTTDLDKAKQLLAEAGYENGFTFHVAVPSNYQPHVDTAQILVEQFKKIGV